MEFQKKKALQWLCATLLILVVPNLICWIAQTKVYMMRGIFVWEYLVLACFYPYISRKLFLAIWALFAIYDVIFATSSLFFMDFFEIIHALTKIPAMPIGDWLKMIGLLTAFIGITLALFIFLLERYNRSYSFLRFKFLWPFIIGLLVVDFFNGHGPLRSWSVKLYNFNTNIVGAPTFTLLKTVRNATRSHKEQEQHVEYLGSLAQVVFAKQPDSAAAVKKEVLVLVESWGLLTDSALQREVMSPWYEMEKNHLYTLRTGTTRFKFLTQAGEFREITGYLFHSFQAKEEWLTPESMVKQKSLFIKKQHEGFHVIGLHGFTSEFYKRKNIWPALGIQETMFAEDFRRLSLPMCGTLSFRGICDTAINTWLLNRMSSQPDKKEFYYWVTLSTHLPLVEIHDDDYKMFAAKWKHRGLSENVLQMAYQDRLLFKDLAHKLSQPGLPKAHILLVGDHAPPFLDNEDHKMYNDQLVPYVELVPN
jgi:phosphoglycerol transferase MdoB-like AlkP superfamily enzyme